MSDNVPPVIKKGGLLSGFSGIPLWAKVILIAFGGIMVVGMFQGGTEAYKNGSMSAGLDGKWFNATSVYTSTITLDRYGKYELFFPSSGNGYVGHWTKETNGTHVTSIKLVPDEESKTLILNVEYENDKVHRLVDTSNGDIFVPVERN